jgi:hypothetical protein
MSISVRYQSDIRFVSSRYPLQPVWIWGCSQSVGVMFDGAARSERRVSADLLVNAASQSSTNGLSKRHHVNMVLRLLLDEHWRLIHGYVLETDGTVRGRFTKWQGLMRTLQELIDDQQPQSHTREE